MTSDATLMSMWSKIHEGKEHTRDDKSMQGATMGTFAEQHPDHDRVEKEAENSVQMVLALREIVMRCSVWIHIDYESSISNLLHC